MMVSSSPLRRWTCHRQRACYSLTSRGADDVVAAQLMHAGVSPTVPECTGVGGSERLLLVFAHDSFMSANTV